MSSRACKGETDCLVRMIRRETHACLPSALGTHTSSGQQRRSFGMVPQ